MHRSARLRALFALLLGAGLVGVVAPAAGAQGGTPHAIEGGRLDYYWDDFARGDSEGLPDLLPLVAGTRADVELRLTAPRTVDDAELTLTVPDALGTGALFPSIGFGGDPAEADPAYWGAVTIRPADYFPFDGAGFRPEGHCTPVPGVSVGPDAGSEAAHTITPVADGQLIRIPGVTCAAGELLRIRLYGALLPDSPRMLQVPWQLSDGDGTTMGKAQLRIEKPSKLRLVVEAPETHQLEQFGSGTMGTAYDVVVRVVKGNGKPDKSWTGWLDVTGDLFVRDTHPCHVLPILVHVGPEDDGVVVVPEVPVAGSVPDQPGVVTPDFPNGLPGSPAYINAWALDRGVTPGSDGPVEALPPPGWPPDQPIFPELACPTSYH